MKKKTSGGFSKTTASCMQETVLRQLVKVAGLQEMTIWRNRNNGWHLSVMVKSGPHVLYLSTRRAPRMPRAFTRLEAALAAGQRIRATRQVMVVLWEADVPAFHAVRQSSGPRTSSGRG